MRHRRGCGPAEASPAHIAVTPASLAGRPVSTVLEFLADHDLRRAELLGSMLTDQKPRAVGALARRKGVTVVSLATAGVFALHDRKQWTAGARRLRYLIDVAHANGATTLVTTSGPAAGLSPETATARLGAALGEAAEYARQSGVVIALEATGVHRADISFVHSLAETFAVAASVEVAACVELAACTSDEAVVPLVRDNLDQIAAVQISDWPVTPLASGDRAVPGDGTAPLRDLAGALVAGGYRGALSVELLGPTIDAEGLARALRRGRAHMQALLPAGLAPAARGDRAG
jgi:sugar phosphate isomerase/epimerase